MAAAMGRSLFGSTIEQVLKSWSALQLAVEQSFGGPDSREKAEWMIYAIETWFQQNNSIHSDEVEDFLADILNEEFDLILEDGSIVEVSQHICLFYRLCQEKKVDEIQSRLQALPKASLHNFRPGANDGNEEMDSDEGTASTSSSSMHQPTASCSGPSQLPSDTPVMEASMDPEEEDGWKVIRKSGRKK